MLQSLDIGEPHCSRCKYQLTGLTSNTCPECGATLTKTAIMIGKPVTRRIIAGCIVMVLPASYGALHLFDAPRNSSVNKWLEWNSGLLFGWASDYDINWMLETYSSISTVREYDPRADKFGSLLFEGQGLNYAEICLDPNGQSVIISNELKTVIWDAAKKRPRKTITAPPVAQISVRSVLE